MSVLDKENLKAKFSNGQKPTGEDFSDLIDSIQIGTPDSGNIIPVSNQIAITGTDSTGVLSPAGLAAHINSRLATQGAAETGVATRTGQHATLMTPARTSQAISYQVPSLVEQGIYRLRDGVSSSYNTLRKMFLLIVNHYYSRTRSDMRYYQRSAAHGGEAATDSIDTRIASSSVAEYGTNTTDLMSPKRTVESIKYNTAFVARGSLKRVWRSQIRAPRSETFAHLDLLLLRKPSASPAYYDRIDCVYSVGIYAGSSWGRSLSFTYVICNGLPVIIDKRVLGSPDVTPDITPIDAQVTTSRSSGSPPRTPWLARNPNFDRGFLAFSYIAVRVRNLDYRFHRTYLVVVTEEAPYKAGTYITSALNDARISEHFVNYQTPCRYAFFNEGEHAWR